MKNQGLGFAIPYLHDGQRHDYIPDFIIRLDNGVHLVLETKGFDVLKEVKVAAAARWVDAVNVDRRQISFGLVNAPEGASTRDEAPRPRAKRTPRARR